MTRRVSLFVKLLVEVQAGIRAAVIPTLNQTDLRVFNRVVPVWLDDIHRQITLIFLDVGEDSDEVTDFQFR